MRIRGFQVRVLSLSAGLVAITAIATTVAALVASWENASANAREDLRLGGILFQELFHTRHSQLLSSVDVLAHDFGFREAAATRDRGTIESALANHGGRVDADLAMLLDREGALLASFPSDLGDFETQLQMRELAAQAEQSGQQAATALVAGAAYQLALVPVRAPLQIGWVCMGFRIDDALAEQLGSLAGLQVSFWGSSAGSRVVLASTEQGEARAGLAEFLATSKAPRGSPPFLLGDALTLETPLPRHEDYGIGALLQTPQSAAVAPYRELRAQLLKLAGAALVVSMLVGIFYGRGVARPVVALAQAAGRVAKGDYSRPVPESAQDEIGDLARAFNSMQQGIAERELRITYQGLHDPLTGLPNRARVRDLLDEAIAQSRGDAPRSLAVLMLDLDRFKEINDALGHAVGDRVLQHVAKRLAAGIRPGDTVARLGGDEFLIVLADTSEGEARVRAEELATRARQPMAIDGTQLSVGASVGVAIFPEHGEEAETLLRRADGAMYDAKAGHADVAVYQRGQDEEHLRRLGTIRDLQAAIEQEGLTLHYQPKVAMRSRDGVELEALLRWEHPQRGFVSPAEFIPLAEQSGAIGPLTRWVLGAVIRQLAEWSRNDLDLCVSVNVSALDLYDEALPDFLMERLESEGVSSRRLTLEITEGAVMKDVEYAIRLLQRVKECGIGLSIDDFGTGYSSLAQLKRLPVNELKIDKSFVIHLRRGSEDDIIVRSTIALAHNLGLKVVAEGVEDRTGWSILDGYGCDVAQGFLIGRPMPAEGVPAWIDGYRKEIGEDPV